MNDTTAIDFFNLPDNVHHCTSVRLGDEIIWRCPVCPDYERRFNLLTGKMSVKGKSEIPHTGFSTKEQNMDALTKNVQPN